MTAPTRLVAMEPGAEVTPPTALLTAPAAPLVADATTPWEELAVDEAIDEVIIDEVMLAAAVVLVIMVSLAKRDPSPVR